MERIRALAPPSGPILRVERCPPPWIFHCERRRAVSLAAGALTLPERPAGCLNCLNSKIFLRTRIPRPRAPSGLLGLCRASGAPL